MAHTADAPHLVMVVGNRVVGDSRVEKAALSAYAAGYRVTVVGLIHRTVPPFGLIGRVPVYRVRPDYPLHAEWQRRHRLDAEEEEQPDVRARAAERGYAQRRLAADAARTDGGRARRFTVPARRALLWAQSRVDTVAQHVQEQRTGARLRVAELHARAPWPGAWRRAWPLIQDLEHAFADVIVSLEPDLIHVHDRHPMPAARTAQGLLAARGRHVPWVYDAHEWLPGVTFTGPAVHGAAWCAAEAELAPLADAVVTVSEELADMLQRRHNLRQRPAVVTNAPFSELVPDPSGSRRTVREECGLAPDVPLLVYVGRIAEKRGVATVVRALADVPGAHLAVVASPEVDLRNALRDVAREVGVADRLHILDYVPAQSVTWYISSATAGVSPLSHTAAHHEALATKVREYLHARLPVVGSDVRAQARFLSRTGVGTVHAADDPVDCARAVQKLLADVDEYRARITPELLAEHSWERQERTLHEVWARLLGDRSPAAGRSKAADDETDAAMAPSRGPRIVLTPVRNARAARPLVKELAEASGGSVRMVAGTGTPRSGLGAEVSVLPAVGSTEAEVRDGVAAYREIVADSDAVLLRQTTQLFGGLGGDADAELAELARHRPVALLLDAVAVTGPGEPPVPDPLDASSEGVAQRLVRQARRTRDRAARAGVPVLVTGMSARHHLPQAVWAPVVVHVADSPRKPGPGPLRVLVVEGERGPQEASAVTSLRAAAGSAWRVAEPGTPLEEVDVVVERLRAGDLTDLAAAALGAGCVVLGHVPAAARAGLPAVLPVVEITPDGLVAAVAGLSRDRDRFADLSAAGWKYAADVHAGPLTAATVLAALGLDRSGAG